MKNTDPKSTDYLANLEAMQPRLDAEAVKRNAEIARHENEGQQTKIRLLGRPKCECGKEGYWQGPRTGLRIFACVECYANHPNRQQE